MVLLFMSRPAMHPRVVRPGFARWGTVGLVAALALSGCGRRANRSVPDRDWASFASHDEAQAFYESEGGRPDGSGRDGHRLDADHDGVACEALL
jgi:hypothetical protein